MRGTYRDPTSRSHVAKEWRETTVPKMMRRETKPLSGLINDTKSLIAIDVGANKGFWAAALMRSFPGQVDHIHMIDPSPENFRELCRHSNNLMFTPEELDHITPYPFAMGDKPGFATLHTNDDGSPLASLYPRANCDHAGKLKGIQLSHSFDVPMDTVDQFIERQRLTHVHLLKVDTEGHEMPIFQGADRSLKAGLIDTITYEFGIHQIHSRNCFLDFWSLFSSLGYSMFRIENDVLQPIDSYSYKYENLSTVYTMVATKLDQGGKPDTPQTAN